jgi:hypothetical protein
MTKAEFLEALEDNEFAEKVVTALLSRCLLACRARYDMDGKAESVEIAVLCDEKELLSDTFSL